MRFPTILAVLLALAAAGYGYNRQRKLDAAVERADFAERRVELAQAENARLREELAAAGEKMARPAEAARRREIEAAVARIRGLKFLKPVDYAILTRAEIGKVLSEKLAEQYTEAEFAELALGLAAMGLLPEGYPLREKYIALLGEQVAAFYDQHAHKLYMFEDASLENSANRVILAHELTHALQDQHFSLAKLPLEIKDNDDRAFAASALIEGDATLVMSAYMLENISLSALTETLGQMATMNTAELMEAPRYLREMLLFPYLQGQIFCTAIQAAGGFGMLSMVYKHPPASTAQILHPEKYPSEAPIRVEWPETSLQGKKPILDNVLGEQGTRIAMEEWGIESAAALRAAEGWRGDRYLIFGKGESLVWRSVWATPSDAEEAAAACEQRAAKIGGEVLRPSEKEVVLLRAASPEERAALVEKFGR